MPIDEIMKQPEVKERVDRLRREQEEFSKLLKRNSFQLNNVVITDLREIERLPAGNRFLIYTLFPEANVSLRVHWGPAHNSVIAAVGHSIFNRTCKTSVGELMSRYGGGGHRGAGLACCRWRTRPTPSTRFCSSCRRTGRWCSSGVRRHVCRRSGVNGRAAPRETPARITDA